MGRPHAQQLRANTKQTQCYFCRFFILGNSYLSGLFLVYLMVSNCVCVCMCACWHVCVFLCALYTVLLVCLCIFVFYREKAKVRGWKGREVERWGGPGKGWGRGTMIRICCKGKIFPIQKNEKLKRIRISSFTSDSQNCPMSESPRVLYSDLRSEFWHGCHKRRTV